VKALAATYHQRTAALSGVCPDSVPENVSMPVRLKIIDPFSDRRRYDADERDSALSSGDSIDLAGVSLISIGSATLSESGDSLQLEGSKNLAGREHF
jgi:hypothetical protein